MNLQSLSEQVTATRRAADSSRRSVEASERGYSLGVTTVSDLLDARRDLYLAQRGAATAAYDYLREWARLQLVSGELEEPALNRISSLLDRVAPSISGR
jgi:outer membrane protein